MLEQVKKPTIRNGVNIDDLMTTIGAVQQDPSLAKFRFSAQNQWLDCGHNRSAIKAFYGCGAMDTTRTVPFTLEADEPAVLLGTDKGANPVEYVLHALVSCMTTSMVYHAAARGIEIESVSTSLEGDLDLQGFLGLSDEVPKGYSTIRVNMDVASNGLEQDLRECISFSPVYEMISRSLPVELKMHVH